MQDIIVSRQISFSTILNEQSQVLMLMRDDMPLYELIGGAVNVQAGETFAYARKRETREEIGCELNVKRHVGDFFLPVNQQHFQYNVAEASLKPGSIINMTEQVGYQWFDRDKLPANIHPLHREIIEQTYKNEDAVEKICDYSAQSVGYLQQINREDIHGLDEWKKHPRVVAKRQAGKLKYDLD